MYCYGVTEGRLESEYEVGRKRENRRQVDNTGKGK